MTDKIKKLEQLSEEVYPKFPTLNRGGYVEDSVDSWLDQHLKELTQIIDYQNYGVDLVDGLEAEVDEAKAQHSVLETELAEAKAYNEGLEAEVGSLRARLAEMEAADSRSLVEEVSNTSELDGLRNELADAKAHIAELEKESAVPAPGTEATRAATLLQHASELGAQYVEQAKADGEQIRKDAEAQLVEMRREIEELEAKLFATVTSLREFHAYELAKLESNPLFAEETKEEETLPEEDSVEDDIIVEETVDGEATEPEAPAAEENAQEQGDEDETYVEAETLVTDEDADVTEEEVAAPDETMDEAPDEVVESENDEIVEDDGKTEDDLR